ncbi:alpha-glucosidase (family GH31 glycosyl hydrolase) [Paenibacillus sp. V4I3]|nr:alpha-glucosidase (family GH31 glycosyl hydrolase) [Paenibacillus sp. V4I3]MDQ0886378.1 alpha-glucosidase (family GH31 glycosyl hydrolase) [Paenibacillus sp. V4I9]
MQAQGQDNIVNLVRCAWAVSQRYGALVWSGDIHSSFEDFREQIVAGLHMGMAGISWWTTDIGGFAGGNSDNPKFRELLIRWFQWGTFCPVMSLHGDRSGGKDVLRKDGSKALSTGGNNEVWSFGDEGEGASWTDARTGSIFEGGQTIHVEALLSKIPVFLRDGMQVIPDVKAVYAALH